MRTGAAETDEALHPVHALFRELTERRGQRWLVEGRERRIRVARYRRGILWVRMGVVARVRVYVRGRCGRTAEQGDGLDFVVMLRDDPLGRHRRGRAIVVEELRVDAEYERGVDGPACAADLGRELVKRVEVVEDIVERTLGDVLPFVDEQHVGVLRLHPRRDARVFVAREVLGVDDCDDRVEHEGTRGLALEFADLEREGGGKGGTGRLDDDSVWTELFCAGVSEGRGRGRSDARWGT